jgi:hypothetical protein
MDNGLWPEFVTHGTTLITHDEIRRLLVKKGGVWIGWIWTGEARTLGLLSYSSKPNLKPPNVTSIYLTFPS